MSMTYDKNLPASFDDFTEFTSEHLTCLRQKIFQFADQETWYNSNKEYFIIDYLAYVYERVAEQFNEGSLPDRQRLVKFRSNGSYLVFHSCIYTKEGSPLFIALKENTITGKWDLTDVGLLSEIDCDTNYGSLPEPIDFDDFCQQFYSRYPIDDSKMTELVDTIEQNLPPLMRKGITPDVWDVAKETLKRDPSKAIPIYRDGEMRFFVPLLYRNSDKSDMIIELTRKKNENVYEVTGFLKPEQAYVLARRMGPVRNYWLIKRKGVMTNE